MDAIAATTRLVADAISRKDADRGRIVPAALGRRSPAVQPGHDDRTINAGEAEIAIIAPGPRGMSRLRPRCPNSIALFFRTIAALSRWRARSK